LPEQSGTRKEGNEIRTEIIINEQCYPFACQALNGAQDLSIKYC